MNTIIISNLTILIIKGSQLFLSEDFIYSSIGLSLSFLNSCFCVCIYNNFIIVLIIKFQI